MSNLDLLNSKIVVLWSGGLDSTCLIKILLNDYTGEIYPIFLKHGQRNEEHEFNSIKHYSEIFKKEHPNRFYEPFIATSYIPAIEFKKCSFKSRTYLRNSDLINNALRLAVEYNISTIVLATFSVDMGDGRPEFFRIKEQEIDIATDYKTKIFSPFFEHDFPYRTKSEVVDHCKKIRFDFSQTRSCYESSASPCGKCDACKHRESALSNSMFDY